MQPTPHRHKKLQHLFLLEGDYTGYMIQLVEVKEIGDFMMSLT
jgi:hypothetical protein